MADRTGLAHSLSYKAGGAAATGSYAAVANTRDVDVADSRAEIELNSRSGAKNRGGLRSVTITVELLTDFADASYTAIKAAFTGGTVISFAWGEAIDGNVDHADFEIVEFTKNEPYEGPATTSVRATSVSAVTASASGGPTVP